MFNFRDPALFKNTSFLVDRFHWKNHACNQSYSLKSINSDEFKRINSQVCEQLLDLEEFQHKWPTCELRMFFSNNKLKKKIKI